MTLIVIFEVELGHTHNTWMSERLNVFSGLFFLQSSLNFVWLLLTFITIKIMRKLLFAWISLTFNFRLSELKPG